MTTPRVLYSLERTREQLTGYFAVGVVGLTVVLHRSPTSLALARPVVPLAWLATAPAARRKMLAQTPRALYARRVIELRKGEIRRQLSSRGGCTRRVLGRG